MCSCSVVIIFISRSSTLIGLDCNSETLFLLASYIAKAIEKEIKRCMLLLSCSVTVTLVIPRKYKHVALFVDMYSYICN